jgi:hypothetical protein
MIVSYCTPSMFPFFLPFFPTCYRFSFKWNKLFKIEINLVHVDLLVYFQIWRMLRYIGTLSLYNTLNFIQVKHLTLSSSFCLDL